MAALSLTRDDAADAVRLSAIAQRVRTRHSIGEWTMSAEAAAPVSSALRQRFDERAYAELWRAGLGAEVDVFETLAERRATLQPGSVPVRGG